MPSHQTASERGQSACSLVEKLHERILQNFERIENIVPRDFITLMTAGVSKPLYCHQTVGNYLVGFLETL